MFQVESSRCLARDLVVRLPVIVDLSSPKRNKTPTIAQFCPFFCWNKFGKSDLALFWHSGCCAVLPMFVFISLVFLLRKLSDAIRQVWLWGLFQKVPIALQFDFDERISAATACPQVFFYKAKMRKISLKSVRRKILTSSGLQSFLYMQSFRLIQIKKLCGVFALELLWQTLAFLQVVGFGCDTSHNWWRLGLFQQNYHCHWRCLQLLLLHGCKLIWWRLLLAAQFVRPF